MNTLIPQQKADLVIGTGGYVCGPMVLAARLHGVPTMIHEQNAFPGVTNKILARFADCIMVNFEESAQYFVHKERIAVTGLPVRQEVLDADKKAGLQYFGFSADKTTLLVTGGSRGARSLNRAMVDAYPELVHHSDLQIIHLTGRLDYDDTIAAIAEKGIDEIADYYFGHLDAEFFPEQTVQVRCDCWHKVRRIIKSLGRKEVEDIMKEQGMLEVKCDYCRKNYVYTEKDLDYLFEEDNK